MTTNKIANWLFITIHECLISDRIQCRHTFQRKNSPSMNKFNVGTQLVEFIFYQVDAKKLI